MANQPDGQPKDKLLERRSSQPREPVRFPWAKPFWDRLTRRYQANRRERGLEKDNQWNAKWLEPIGITPDVFSRYRTGKRAVPEATVAKLREFFDKYGPCWDDEQFALTYSHESVLDLESWEPEVGTFDWLPFCDRAGRKGFLVYLASRGAARHWRRSGGAAIINIGVLVRRQLFLRIDDNYFS